MINAVLDEIGLEVGSLPIDPQFRGLADILAKMREDAILVGKRSDSWWTLVRGELTLTDLLFVSGHLDEDVRQQLIREIDRLNEWDGEGEPRTSRAFAEDEIGKGTPTACVVLSMHSQVRQVGGGELHFISNPQQAIKFYQTAAILGRYSEKELLDFSRIAFPHLHFHPDLERQISRFSKKYDDELRTSLVSALTALNDELPLLLLEHPDLRDVARHFRASTNFEISPESPNTHRNDGAMRERDVMFGKEKIRCEWHLKLEPHRDRIHFYFGDHSVADDKILIGIFCEHLST